MRPERSRALKARVASLRRVHASAVSRSVERAQPSLANPSHVCTPQPRVVRAAIMPCTHAPMHPCTHAPMRACVQTTTQTIHADNRRAFRARVGRPVILSGSRARLEHHPRTTASPRPRPTRARTHTHTYHAHTPPRTHRHRAIASRDAHTKHPTHRIASHRIASHRDRRRVPVLAFLGTATPAPTTPGDDAFDASIFV